MTDDISIQHKDVPSLISLLQEQIRVSKQLCAMTDRQSELVSQARSEYLLDLLGQRQQLIDRLDAMSAELAPYRSQWSEFWDGLNKADRQRVGPLVTQTQQLLSRIMEADDRDQQRLLAAQHDMSGELDRLQQTGTARKAYRPVHKVQVSRFTDQQG